jgi:type IV pilus assembly protein PilV
MLCFDLKKWNPLPSTNNLRKMLSLRQGMPSSKSGSLSRRNESGFTIIEILIAVVLIVIGLVAFGVLGGSIVDQNALQKRSDLALTLAQQKLEELKNTALSTTLTTSNNGSDNPTLLNNTFTRTWTITNGAAGSMASLSVTVSWSDKGQTKIERLKTYISQ